MCVCVYAYINRHISFGCTFRLYARRGIWPLPPSPPPASTL